LRRFPVERLFADVGSQLGGLDCLINNAGIAGPTGKVEEIDVEEWERCIAIDLNGMFYCTRLGVPMLKEAGGGSIINLSSAAGRLAFPYRTPYAAAKWGVVGFSKSLSMELGEDKIRVNAIQPGKISLERVSMKQMVSPHDIANMALYLASPLGATITGQALSVCAGLEMLG
jgi:NAD(P)-dependent dehydrogenase (short-subunit alcohol dehydrogenase family)